MTIALAVVALLVTLIVVWSRSRSAARLWGLIAVAAAAILLLMEGWRPAMAPLLIWIAFIGIFAPRICGRVGDWRRWFAIPARIAMSIAALSCAVLTAITWIEGPPEVAGPYSVGSFDWVVEDPQWPELHTQDPDDHRRILVRVWYPGEAPPKEPGERSQWSASLSAHRVPYMAEEVVDGLLGDMLAAPLARLAASELSRVNRPGAQGIPLAPDAQDVERKFPVLLYSPGYGLPIDLATSYLAEVASHGYVVLGVNVTYETAVTVLPDGRVLRRNELLAQNDRGRSHAEEERLGEKARALLPPMTALMDTPEPQRRARYLELRQSRMEWEQFLADAIDERVQDLQRVLDRIEALDSASVSNLLSNRIDLSRIGVFGMSLGGPTAGQFCLADERCKAGLNYDGEIWGDQLERMDARVPFMWMQGRPESAQARAFILGMKYVFEATLAPAYHIELASMGHMHFTDMAFLSPAVSWLGLPLEKKIGEPRYVESGRRMALDYTVAFFDRYLKGASAELLDAAPGRLEVHVERRNIAARH